MCQSGEIWNKKAFFSVYFNFFYYIKQIDSMLPCVCSEIDHRGRQNVIRTSGTHSAAPRVPLFCSYHILTSSVIYYWTDARQHGIYLLTTPRCSRQCVTQCLFFSNSSFLAFPNGFFHGCTFANANAYVLPQNDYNSAWIFAVTEQLK